VVALATGIVTTLARGAEQVSADVCMRVDEVGDVHTEPIGRDTSDFRAALEQQSIPPGSATSRRQTRGGVDRRYGGASGIGGANE
jgi:hypothetical protein